MQLSRGSRWFLGFLLLSLVGVAGALWWADATIFDDGVTGGEPVEYTVQRGQTVRGVGEDLAELGVLRSAVRFRLAAEDAGLAEKLQPGRFELETGMAIEQVIEVLAAGPIAPPSIRFTVPEGLTVEQTLERLAAQFDAFTAEDLAAVLAARRDAGENGADLLRLPEWIPEPGDVDAGLEAFEGVLWPQTYEVDDTAGPLAVLQRMVDQLNVELQRVPVELREELTEAELYERLIVASLIERETRVNTERGTVAGVIANRREQGMRLQIDATVVYARGGEPGALVSLADLEIDSPYNTYRVDGLPPTPISGVGTASLQAAFAPAEVPYLFYVLDPACDGSHRFAETLDEHNRNVAEFRANNRCEGEELPG